MVKGLTKGHLCTTHGHGQQYEDWLGEGRGWSWVREGKERKTGTTVNSINNKNKIK